MGTSSYGAWASVIQIFVSPRSVFSARAEVPAVVPPYLVGTAVTCISAYLTAPTVLSEMETRMLEQGLGTTSAMESVRMWTLVGTGTGALLGPLLSGFLITSLIVGLTWVQGHTPSFKVLLSIIGYARLPLTLNTLVNSVLVIYSNVPLESIRFGLDASVLAPSSSPTWVGALLSTLAPLELWSLYLVAVGVSVALKSNREFVWWPALILYGISLLESLLTLGTVA